MSDILIVGVATASRLDAAQFEPKFEAPSNYGEDAAAKYVVKERAKFLAGAACDIPHVGEISSLCIIDTAAGGVLEFQSTLAAVDWLRARGQDYADLVLVGFNPGLVWSFLRLYAAEIGKPLPGTFGKSPVCYDLRETICPYFSFDKWQAAALQRLLKSCPYLPASSLGKSARLDAAIASAVCLQFDFWPERRHQLLKAIMEAVSPPASPASKSLDPLGSNKPKLKLPLPKNAK